MQLDAARRLVSGSREMANWACPSVGWRGRESSLVEAAIRPFGRSCTTADCSWGDVLGCNETAWPGVLLTAISSGGFKSSARLLGWRGPGPGVGLGGRPRSADPRWGGPGARIGNFDIALTTAMPYRATPRPRWAVRTGPPTTRSGTTPSIPPSADRPPGFPSPRSTNGMRAVPSSPHRATRRPGSATRPSRARTGRRGRRRRPPISTVRSTV